MSISRFLILTAILLGLSSLGVVTIANALNSPSFSTPHIPSPALSDQRANAPIQPSSPADSTLSATAQSQADLASSASLNSMVPISSSQPFVNALILDSASNPSVGATVQLYRYPEGSGDPQLVAQSTTDSTGYVSLSDPSLSSFQHKSSYVHYGITAIRTDNAKTEIGNNDWSALTKTGMVESRTFTIAMNSYPTSNASSSLAPAASISPFCLPTSSVSPNCGGLCQGMNPIWAPYANLGEFWTDIGEVHASDGVSATFDYGVSSGSTIDVAVSVGGGPWQISGSYTVTNTLTTSIKSSPVTAAAYKVQSHLTYTEYQYEVCQFGSYVPASPAQYKVQATNFVGDAQFGSLVGGDYASPCAVVSGAYGVFGQPQAGWTRSVTESSGQTYTAAVQVTGTKGGATASVTLSDTTSYGTSTTIDYSIGFQYPYVYFYSGGSSSYLVVYWTTPGVGCPGTDSAQFISQTLPPSTMCTAQTANVGVTMKNTGTSTWGYDGPNPWRLGAQNPQDNNIWGMGRVNLASTVSPGGSYTFSWTVSAPSTSGTYNFQWRMVHELVTWFGDFTPNLAVNVILCPVNLTPSPASLPADGTSLSTITAQLPDQRPNVAILFTTTLGVLSTQTCTTGSIGSCSVTIRSSTTGVATVTANAAGYAQTQTTVTFFDFSLSPNVSTLTIYQGNTGSATVTLTSLNGYTGTVSLTPSITPSGPGVFVSQSTVTLSTGASQTITVTITTTTSTNTGTYTVSVLGTQGTLSHTATFTLIVPDFSISANPTTLNLSSGSSTGSTISLTSLGGFAGTVTVSANPPAGITVSPSPTSVTLTSGGTSSYTLTVSASSSLSPGTYTVTVTGTSGSLAHSASITVTVTVQGFSLSSSPASLTITLGSEQQNTITVTSLGSWAGSVTLTQSASSSAVGCWFSGGASSITLSVPSGGSVSTIPACAGWGPAGSYSDTFTGTSGSLSNSVNVPITVTDFSISAPSVSFIAGSSTSSTVSLTSLQGFSGTVNLSVSAPTGVTVSCPASATVPSGGTATPSCTYSSSTVGTYTVTITGTYTPTNEYYNAAINHSVSITVTVNSGGGGGGSVAAGTLITLADGTQIPVQNLKLGMQLLSYNMASHQYVITTTTSLVTVVTHNQMVIETTTGKPLIVDQNTAQKVYVKLPDGTVTLMSVTDLKVGYDLFDALSQTWVPITAIHYENSGNHIMYDIYNTTPGNYIANGYLDPVKL